jgi:hypothetical protein
VIARAGASTTTKSNGGEGRRGHQKQANQRVSDDALLETATGLGRAVKVAHVNGRPVP